MIKSPVFKKNCFAAAWFLCGVFSAAHAAELTAIHGARLVDDRANDGDSFVVAVDGGELHIRLYYVDCMETQPGSEAEVKRIREQMGYFGLPDARDVVRFGREAGEFTARALAEPFTIWTSYANALGRSKRGRVYGFVKTHSGRYLSKMLVENGLARVYGKSRENPDGVPSKIVWQELHDLQIVAILNRAGIWKESDPEQITRLRAALRKGEQDLDAIKKSLRGCESDGPVDLNRAASEELQCIQGIGPVMAGRIIAGRPYNSVGELLRVRGIGEKTLGEISRYLKVEE